MPEALFPIFENSPFTKLTGIEFTERGEGYSQVILKITEPVLRIVNGSVHGGAIATLLDVGMGAALLTCLNKDQHAATVQMQIHYLSPAMSGVLVCNSKVIRKGRSIASLESEVANKGTVIAKATGTYYISKAKVG